MEKKKLKLPRKRKKQYIKDHSSTDYMGVCIVNEICIESGQYNKAYNPYKIIKKASNYPNGQLKKVISFY